MNCRISCFFVLSSFFLQKGFALLDKRIIGGTEAFQGQFDYFAAITVQTFDSSFFCGGALIDHEWILTSGHCVNNAILLTIQLGSNNLVAEDSNRVTVATSSYYIHPDFNPDSIENDIALIKLRLKLDYSLYIGLVTLPLEDVLYPTSLLTVGHGQTSDSVAGLSQSLLYAVVTSISNNECKIFYGNQVNDMMLCAIGNFNQGTCTGDTGGPLILASGKLYQVVAVSSFISANGCESIYPSGYTRVYPYLDWINGLLNSDTQ